MTASYSMEANGAAPHHYPAAQSIPSLDSTLSHLALHSFQVEASCPVQQILQTFERYPQLPGVVLMQKPVDPSSTGDRLLGMISRQCLLEMLLRPDSFELFLTKPVQVLYGYVRRATVIVSVQTPIVQAAQQAMRRSPECWGEPLLVQTNEHLFCMLDVHELNRAYWHIYDLETKAHYERAQIQMTQIEKMASLGRLVDGVAHEILDPVGFIWGNLTHVSRYVDQLLLINAAYEAAIDPLPDPLKALKQDGELEYLTQDLPKAIASIQAGADRLKKLATSLQNFCHIDDVYPKAADLHECLDAVVLLLKSRLKSEIEVVKCYGHLPPVFCYVGQLSQVFMDILTYAIEALLNQAVYQQQAKALTGQPSPSVVRPQITLTTAIHTKTSEDCQVDSRWVTVCIANNGVALTLEQQQHLLECFSTPNSISRESRLGLSYHIVTAKHGGMLSLRSPCFADSAIAHDSSAAPCSYGTEFEIVLPLG